jgi:hypothetical protein
MRANTKWQGMERDNEAPKLTTEPAQYDLVIDEQITKVTERVIWNVKLVRLTDDKTLASCTYWPVVEDDLDVSKARSESDR